MDDFNVMIIIVVVLLYLVSMKDVKKKTINYTKHVNNTLIWEM